MSDHAAVPESWGDPRSKTVTWYDPLTGFQAGSRLSGMDYLLAIQNGELPPPPMGVLLGFRVNTVEKGEVTFVCTPDESVYNPIGMVHGGLVCTILDSVVGCAVQTLLPAGTGYTSVEIKVNYLRPIRSDTGTMLTKGWVTKPGRRVAFAEGDVRDSAGNLLATASSTLLILNG
jgi:uncharacterized protein (TIGR00369 family)